MGFLACMQENFQSRWLRDDLKISLSKHHQDFTSSNQLPQESLEEYEVLIRDILSKLLR